MAASKVIRLMLRMEADCGAMAVLNFVLATCQMVRLRILGTAILVDDSGKTNSSQQTAEKLYGAEVLVGKLITLSYCAAYLLSIMATLTAEEVKAAAEASSTVLKKLGYSSCVVGSVACMIWGMQNRTPKDVDIVVLDTNAELEAVKLSITNTDSNFYLVNSVDPFASYKVLWYQIPTTYYGGTKRCKIDLLKPGELTIPSVPTGKLYKAYGDYENIRVMPFIPVLLLKVQAWRHHATSDKLHFLEKVSQDTRDINELLDIALRNDYYSREVKDWLPNWILDVGRRHVEQYKRDYPSSASAWVRIMG